MTRTKAVAIGALMALVAGFNTAPAQAQDDCVTSESPIGQGYGCAEVADEFNGTSVDTALWSVRDGYTTDQDPYGVYRADAVNVSGGVLSITTDKGSGTKGAGQSGELTTAKKMVRTNGLWEFKVRYSNQGHGGGYLYGTTDTPWVQQGEIDAYEAFGDTDRSTGTGATDGFDASGKNQIVAHYSQDANNAFPDLDTHTKATWLPTKMGEWEVVSILKNDDGITVYRDGVERAHYPTSDPKYALSFPEDQGLHVTLTARVSNNYWGVQTAQTGGAEFDYVRYWPLEGGQDQNQDQDPSQTQVPDQDQDQNDVTPSPAASSSPSWLEKLLRTFMNLLNSLGALRLWG